MKYQINDFTIDTENRKLSAGGAETLLDHRHYELLLFFIKNPNKPIARDEILNEVWGDKVVNDHALTQAISELRRSLSSLNDDNKKLIKTLPKVGYMFIGDVCIAPSPIGVVTGRHSDSKWKFSNTVMCTVLMVAMLVLAGGLTMFGDDSKTDSTTRVFDPNLVEFRVFDSMENEKHIAFGLSDLINYRINMLSNFRSSLVYGETKAFTDAGILISGRISKSNSGKNLEISVYDNINDELVFQGQYSLSSTKLVSAPGLVLRDFENLMDVRFDSNVITMTEKQYPSDLNDLNLMYEAHHAYNTSDIKWLHHGQKLYEKVLTKNPKLEIAAAERLIIMQLIIATSPDTISLSDYESAYEQMLSIKSKYPPPVFYEARAIHSLSSGLVKEAREFVEKAIAVRGSWISYIIVGKIAEMNGDKFKASRAYAQSYAMKPDENTIETIRKLLFPSDLR